MNVFTIDVQYKNTFTWNSGGLIQIEFYTQLQSSLQRLWD